MAALSLFLRSLVFENDPQYLSLQYTLKIRSLSMVWNENDRFWLVFTKTLVFMPKTGSLHTGTGGSIVLPDIGFIIRQGTELRTWMVW
jgi:hypothetical protein